MTLFLNAHSDRLAPGSFQQPVPIPAHLPGEPDLVQVCFNSDWLPYVLGCLFQLTLSTTWQASTQDELLSALQAANDLLLIFQLAKPGCAIGLTGPEGNSGDDMCCCLRMQDGNLQVFSCGVWTTVDGWDKAAIAPGQPGVGSPQPASGQCQSFSGVIGPTNPWVLPVPVNAGDVVTVTNLNGSWSPTAFTDLWLCPDGNIFFGGICINGTSALDPGAPMPTAPLNGTILFDGTNYYDVSMAANLNMPIAITILPGVVNAQLLVRCNFHGGVDPAGSVLFEIQVCNNVPAVWAHTFDLTAAPGPFVVRPVVGGTGSNGTWVAGTGFKPGLFNDGPGVEVFNVIDVWATGLTPFKADTELMTFDYTLGRVLSGTEAAQAIFSENGGLTTIERLNQSAPLTGSNQTLMGGASPASQTTLRFYIATDTYIPPNTPTGDATLKTITVTGKGPDPFAAF